ncbi:MAG: hypothetical protein GX957_00995 [Clostridiaceae bacterium]|nr:hypothetical protein [Clostridiaceae bacterium]
MASLTSAPQNLSNNAKDAGLDHEYVALNTLFTDQSAEIAADTGWRGMFISKDCSNPEAAIKAVLFLTSKEDNGYNMLWGKEGEDWNWNEDKTEAILNWTTAESDLMEQRQFLWGWLGHDGISNNMQYGNTPANREALEWVGKIIERNPVLGKVMNQMDTESEEFIIYQNLLELNKLHANKIMLASSEEEALKLYDEMIQNADDLGGQRLNEWANTLYLDMKIEYEKVRHIGEEGWLKEEQLN